MTSRWLIVAALFTVTFSIANPMAAFGVFLPVLSGAFGWSRGAISVAMSINLLLGGFIGFAAGAIADRYGPRLPLTVMAIFSGAGFGLVSTVSSLWQLYVFVGIMAGVGMAGFYVVSAATVARWFESQRGLALGIVLTGFSLGYMTGGPAAAILVERVGWRVASAIMGGGFAIVGALAALAVRYPRPGEARSTPAHSSRPNAEARHSFPGAGVGAALAESPLWCLCGSWFLTGFVLMMTSVHVVPYATDLGLGLEQASLALTAYGIGGIIGRVALGVVADRFGSTIGMRLCFALQVLAMSTLLMGRSHGLLLVAVLIFGVGFGGADTVFVRAVPEVFGMRALGSIMGVLSLGWRLGASLGPTVAGYVRDASGSYAIPFGTAPLALVVAFALFARGTSSRAARGR